MSRHKSSNSPSGGQVSDHYASGYEENRLKLGSGHLERERSKELLTRYLPKPPAAILDVGGGAGEYSLWLAKEGYQAHLIDIVPLHVEQAREASKRQPDTPLASAEVGDACALSWEDATVDACLLFGPLYHLTDAADRRVAFCEAFRVLKPGGTLMAAAISRFASILDGISRGFLKDEEFVHIVSRDLEDGQHRNPTNHPDYFMDTYFHLPDELRQEVETAGFEVEAIVGVEGPSWLVPDFESWWSEEMYRDRLLWAARAVESESALLGISSHLMAAARKQG